jgi:formiminotetrahydrofolate cyclodeaminase
LKRKVHTLQYHLPTPFDSVENTQEYFGLLSETLEEVKQEIARDIAAATEAQQSRRLEALRLVHFKLQKLEEHVKASSFLLNDLRTLRRLLLHERVRTEEVISK